MVGIVKTRQRFWNNRHSLHSVLEVQLDLRGCSDWRPAELDPALREALKACLPDCPDDIASGSMMQFIASAALCFQSAFDTVSPDCGVVRKKGKDTKRIFFAVRDYELAETTVRAATALALDLAAGQITDTGAMRSAISRSLEACRTRALDPSTRAVVRELIRRDIPFQRHTAGLPGIRCGLGAKQRSFAAGLTSGLPALQLQQVQHKPWLLEYLKSMDLPVGRFLIADQPHEAVKHAQELGLPVRMQPVVDGSGVALMLRTAADVRAAAQSAAGPVMLRPAADGDRHLFLVVDGTLVSGLRMGAVRSESDEPGPDRAPVDVTDAVHPFTAESMERAAKILELPVASIEFACSDVSKPWPVTGGRIEDIRAGDSLQPHLTAAPHRDPAGAIVDSMFPGNDDGRIPTAMVTGTIGKTTTCHMLSFILREAGHVVGKATTSGVEIDGSQFHVGDSAAAGGARIVVRDPRVTAAVLETGRGGLLSFGSYLDQCDVGALLSVDTEHVGRDGIETVEAMARHKRKVTDCARKAVVLNALCPHSSALIGAYPPEKVIVFSLDESADHVAGTLSSGGRAVVMRNGETPDVVIAGGGSEDHVLCAVHEMPAALGGHARHNVANALAAAGLALGLGVDPGTIGRALQAFTPTKENLPSRMNFIDGYPFQVVFDWACNPQGFEGIMPALDGVAVSGRRLVMLMGIGNRFDEDYARMARTAAGRFDLYIPYDGNVSVQKREPGEVAGLLAAGLAREGVPPASIRQVGDIREGLKLLLEVVRPGDLMVVLGTRIDRSLRALHEVFGQPEDWSGTGNRVAAATPDASPRTPAPVRGEPDPESGSVQRSQAQQ